MKIKRGVALFVAAAFCIGAVLCISGGDSFACSRVLSADNGQAVLAARNMDWPENIGTDLWVLPRGIKRDGLVATNPLAWTSHYGSVVTVSYDHSGKGLVADGMNEKGLAANALWLGKSDYGKRDERVPGLSISMWAQYFLDNYATVEEAVAGIEKPSYQIVTLTIPEGARMETAYLHLSLEDKSGDSAIIEYVAGKPVIHHDRRYTVMTNDPVFEKQLDNLKQYEGFGGDKPLPGTTTPEDRFVRASYYLKYLPKPANKREALAGIFSITRNISQPFRASVDPANPHLSATVWRTVADMTHAIYYFELTTSPYLIWVRLNDFDLNAGASAMKLDLGANPDRVGDVSGQFVPAKPFEFVPSGPQGK